MADVSVKPEIKVDPATSTPQTLNDVKEFVEEPHDLEIPPAPEEGGGQAWLVKLPKYLWQHWANIYRNSADDEPIEIGKMRVKNPSGPNQDPLQQQIQIRLAPAVPEHKGLPMTYNLNLKTHGYSGTVVFSEKDKPEHDSNRRQNRGSKPSGIQSKNDRYGRYQNPTAPGTYRTAIPKQTALAPVIQHVADAMPQDDESYKKFAKKQLELGAQPNRRTIFTKNIEKTAGRSNLGAFSVFRTTSRPGNKKKTKDDRDRFVRLPREQLLDALDKCFRRYKYWSLKALRYELKQPEAWVKSTLEQIAVLVRSGDFAMNWMLKPEFANEHGIKDEDVKQEHKEIETEDEGLSGLDSGAGVESEDDEGFEDVKMED